MSNKEALEVERLPVFLHWQETSTFKETYAGAMDTIVVEGQYLKPKGVKSDTILIFMHPTGTMNLLPMPNALAAAGIHCLCCGSRYPHNDTALIMEKVILDLGHYIRYAKEKLGFKRVILAGWSGGGSLSMFYQSQAENPTITHTPAGDPVDVVGANLIPADAVLQLAAHVSRAIILTEWLDASILDETDLSRRDVNLNLYDPQNPHQPPYTDEYVAIYREAQVARSKRIDDFVFTKLAELKAANTPNEEFCFTVHGTMADPRWLDLNVDPNDRKGPNWCFMGEPRTVNMMPAGLARFSSLRAWLSQWSLEHSRANGPKCAADVTVPVLIIENSADDGCTPSHGARLLKAVQHGDKEFHVIKGATHYYIGQPDKMEEAVSIVSDWLKRKSLLEG
ncbi:MAG: alpha/beta fold hydrolase [Alphaproteobacteria bacterium]|nr:alpha/beta hydrolase [Rhodobiaceae bacterium]MBO6544428.1 alpha/beta fold hydrolase [Alphaproteobacteria bacterium]MBO6628779.1 alpha/beta fold hydrolase [Alphaproteobacteria bacterium]MDF1627339.1 alpha/beta hydrolase [Parvibaculaceae bacterium]